MPGPAQPQSASTSIWDTVLRMLPQSGGIMKASDALGLAASKSDLQAQLAKLKQAGPVDGMHTKARGRTQMDALQNADQRRQGLAPFTRAEVGELTGVTHRRAILTT
jgi:hypothetical protein